MIIADKSHHELLISYYKDRLDKLPHGTFGTHRNKPVVYVEIEIKINEYLSFYPDVTFFIPEMDKPVAIELDGAVDNQDYYIKAENRKRQYLLNGFTELRDIIFFRIINPYQFDCDQLEALIVGSLVVNSNNIIFP